MCISDASRCHYPVFSSPVCILSLSVCLVLFYTHANSQLPCDLAWSSTPKLYIVFPLFWTVWLLLRVMPSNTWVGKHMSTTCIFNLSTHNLVFLYHFPLSHVSCRLKKPHLFSFSLYELLIAFLIIADLYPLREKDWVYM